MKKTLRTVLFLCIFLKINTTYAAPPATFSENASIYFMHYETELHFSKAVPFENLEYQSIRHNSFVIGNLAYMPSRENSNATGAPLRIKSDIKILSITPTADGGNTVRYQYEGKVVLTRSGLTTFSLTLPDSIESLDKMGLQLGYCSIYGYGEIATADMLAVYWNPYLNRRCTVPYSKISATLTAVPESVTYPEYARLVNQKGEMNISVFFGKVTAGSGNNPYGGFRESPDGDASQEYLTVASHLIRLGFKRTQTLRNDYLNTPYQEVLEGVFGSIKIKAHLVYGDSVYQEPSMKLFNSLFVESALTDSVVFYSGHAGFLVDGTGLSIYPDMPLVLNPNQYQIFGMNGCQTNYYQFSLNDLKSSKNLDLFLNAREVSSNPYFTTAMIDALVTWSRTHQRTSYQDLVRRMDAAGGLTGVVGDEDNSQE